MLNLEEFFKELTAMKFPLTFKSIFFFGGVS